MTDNINVITDKGNFESLYLQTFYIFWSTDYFIILLDDKQKELSGVFLSPGSIINVTLYHLDNIYYNFMSSVIGHNWPINYQTSYYD